MDKALKNSLHWLVEATIELEKARLNEERARNAVSKNMRRLFPEKGSGFGESKTYIIDGFVVTAKNYSDCHEITPIDNA